ncbi:MAG TPA: VOC family protein [Ornithinibacter sp.]|nr:VOC family protein [Ornithinibacter sp.]
MTSRVSHTTIDCHDAFALSEWWKGVLDYVDVEGDPNLPGHEECMILSRDGSHRLLFIEVPDEKVVKNRIHLDVEPVEGARDDELARLLAHGAAQVADHRGQYGPGTGWVILADPEGNEFCILRSQAERDAAASSDGTVEGS